MDDQVLKAQRWVNATYAGVTGYNLCTEDGITGWATIHSLTRALQHELGITALSDSFGPTTLADLNIIGDITVATPQTNIRIIVEGALYCKGYSGGSLDGTFTLPTQQGLGFLQEAMGFSADSVQIGHVTPKVLKALLTMDAYVTLDGGSDLIQSIQQWMNRTFTVRRDFYIIPCDGIFSRAVHSTFASCVAPGFGFMLLGPRLR